jgi:RES domain-containing protein
VRLRGLVYRAHNPRWAFAPDSGAGAAQHGGRFNPAGTPALYTSLRIETAWLEAQQGFPFKAQPMTLCAYDVDCEGIADLTDAATRASLNIATADLACAWEKMMREGRTPPSWQIGQALRASGHAGLLARSFAPGATDDDWNAIFWQWSRDPPHQVRVIDDFARLPRDDSSWR